MKPQVQVGMMALALSLFFGYHAFYKSQQDRVHLIQAQSVEEQTRQRTQLEVVALAQRVEHYRHRLLQTPEPSVLVREVAVLAKKAGVQLSTIGQEPPQEFPQFTRLAVNLQCSATYHQLGAFLDYLEHAEHFIRAESITVTPGSDGRSTISLVVSSLYVPPLLDGQPG